MRCDDLKIRIDAAQHILDRAWGKPSAQVDLMHFDYAHEKRQAEYAASGCDEYGLNSLDYELGRLGA
jgi:hypothetical protein